MEARAKEEAAKAEKEAQQKAKEASNKAKVQLLLRKPSYCIVGNSHRLMRKMASFATNGPDQSADQFVAVTELFASWLAAACSLGESRSLGMVSFMDLTSTIVSMTFSTPLNQFQFCQSTGRSGLRQELCTEQMQLPDPCLNGRVINITSKDSFKLPSNAVHAFD